MTGDPTPSTGWLYMLNNGPGAEAPAPTSWMSVYNGTDNADPFFQAVPGGFDDTASPHLAGAVNVTCAQTYHNDLRVRPDIVQAYLRFLHQNRPGGSRPIPQPTHGRRLAPGLAAHPADLDPETPGGRHQPSALARWLE